MRSSNFNQLHVSLRYDLYKNEFDGKIKKHLRIDFELIQTFDQSF
jgi:hypothetical protein